jgi:acetylornithine aminotransferase
LREIAHRYPNLITEVRGWGLINGMELNADIELTSVNVVKAAMERGLLLVPAGPKVIRFVPPLIVSAEEIDQAAQAVEDAIASLAS